MSVEMLKLRERFRAAEKEIREIKSLMSKDIIGKTIHTSKIKNTDITDPTISDPVITGGTVTGGQTTGRKHVTPVFQGDVKFQVDDDDSAPATWSKTDNSKEIDTDSTAFKNADLIAGSSVIESIVRAHEGALEVPGSKLTDEVPVNRIHADVVAKGSKLADTVPVNRMHADFPAKGSLLADNVPNAKLASGIDAAKLTTGTLPIARIAAGAVDNTKLASGVDAAKLTTGTLPIARIAAGAVVNTKLGADIDASKVTAGTLPDARIQSSGVTQHNADIEAKGSKLTDAVTDAKLPQTMTGKTFTAQIVTEAGISLDGHVTETGTDTGKKQILGSTPELSLKDSSGAGTNAAGKFQIRDSAGTVIGYISVDGTSGDVTLYSKNGYVKINSGDSGLIPADDKGHYLGHAAAAWADAYIGDTSLLAMLGIGTANAFKVSCSVGLQENSGTITFEAGGGRWQNVASGTPYINWYCHEPTVLGGLKMKLKSVTVGLYDADANNKVADIYIRGCTSGTNYTNIDSDASWEKTSTGDHTFTPGTPIDMSSYVNPHIFLQCATNTPSGLDITYVTFEIFYEA